MTKQLRPISRTLSNADSLPLAAIAFRPILYQTARLNSLFETDAPFKTDPFTEPACVHSESVFVSLNSAIVLCVQISLPVQQSRAF